MILHGPILVFKLTQVGGPKATGDLSQIELPNSNSVVLPSQCSVFTKKPAAFLSSNAKMILIPVTGTKFATFRSSK